METPQTKTVTAPASEKKPSKFATGVFIVTLAASIALGVSQKVADARTVQAVVTIGGHAFRVEVANTPKKKEKGLGGREALAADRGMYFPFDTAEYWVFWMKDMRIPIDAVWIQGGKVVDLTRKAQPPRNNQPPQTFAPGAEADAVLEIAAGRVDALGLKIGDEVVIKP